MAVVLLSKRIQPFRELTFADKNWPRRAVRTNVRFPLPAMLPTTLAAVRFRANRIRVCGKAPAQTITDISARNMDARNRCFIDGSPYVLNGRAVVAVLQRYWFLYISDIWRAFSHSPRCASIDISSIDWCRPGFLAFFATSRSVKAQK